jgi:hypothetical protein
VSKQARDGKHLEGVVHARETKAILCQSIEMGRIHLTAVATDIGKAHVVHKDEYDVWALFENAVDRETKRAITRSDILDGGVLVS